MKCIVLNKNKIVITNIIIYLCIFVFLTNSKVCIASITNSTNIFITKLLPALFPYILITELILELNIAQNLTYGFSKIICKIFQIPVCAAPTILISYLLGYPNAAKYIYKLYNNNEIDLYTVKKLCTFTHNASPAYILVSIGLVMYNNIMLGIILLISHAIASILIGIFPLPNKIIIQQNNIISNSFKEISFSFEILLKSLLNSIKTLCIIWGFTVIFSLLPMLMLNKLNIPNNIRAILIGIFELSNGINLIIINNSNLTLSLCLVSFILSFSSFMVILQVYSFLYKTGIKLSYILKYKLLQGVISCTITYVLTSLLLNNHTIPVILNTDNYIANTPVPYYIYFIIAVITGILLLTILKKKR